MMPQWYQGKGDAVKVWTIRLPDELDKQLTDYAKAEDMSKNQAIKKAVRLLLQSDKKGA